MHILPDFFVAVPVGCRGMSRQGLRLTICRGACHSPARGCIAVGLAMASHGKLRGNAHGKPYGKPHGKTHTARPAPATPKAGPAAANQQGFLHYVTFSWHGHDTAHGIPWHPYGIPWRSIGFHGAVVGAVAYHGWYHDNPRGNRHGTPWQ